MISVVPKFRKQKSPAQSARHQKHKNMLKCRFPEVLPIALHIRDSTLHFLQCPSSFFPWAEKATSATPPFPPPAAHGSIGRGYSSSLHLYLPYLLSDVSVGLFFIHNIPKH